MFKVFVLALLGVCAYAAFFEESFSRFANEKPSNFQYGFNKRFAGYSLERLQKMMGTKLDKRPGAPIKTYPYVEMATSFSSAQNWPNCASTISYIKDQADCGSCWAVAASEVVADRTCIANYGSMTPEGNMFLNENRPAVDMSAEEIMSCCSWCGGGCQGGYPIDAMRYWAWTGIVTGGWYGSNCGCLPYQVPPCPASGCSGPEQQTPRCKKSCRSGYARSYNSDKHYAQDHYQISGNANAIMQEIQKHGSVECAFEVYENFMHYTSGVYDHTSGQYLGGHAIKIVGWGQQGSTPYWIINNSWNVTWGQNGVFWFLRGSDLAGMESQCVAGIAKASDSNFKLTC